ncbi:MAG: inorganic phosphate transporter [Bacteroidetes bacterium]|nr:inorganic phosphate transporter [Bacteroidota bacterium]MBL6943115.1 inorganic phosphate transporter [Bacteroidales bacterium]
MEFIYLIIVVLLFFLAGSDLIVGVTNDAVNFLTSAVGSKVASFRVIMLVAAIGILIGAVFSSGMMEVARKGIFNPGEFYFSEIMIIFMAVMVTDVILLDAYNTWGLPTSTTVSIVFELLGAAVAMASIKFMMSDGGITIGQFINSSKALAIISGILLSVAIAFTFGALIQYFARIAFSFNVEKRIKYIGAVWGGIAFTALTYFMLIKGAKGASFMSGDVKDWIELNSLSIIFYSLIGWTLILQFLFWIFRINILKIIVLVGTFSLAMAFAGNDLVNFIGVPIAGYNSWEIFSASGSDNPDGFLMTALGGPVLTPEIFLVAAGAIMVLTLYFSKKARSVLKTEIDLSRQSEGIERFKPTWFSKLLVRSSLKFSNNVKQYLPDSLTGFIERQFEPVKENKRVVDKPAFDLIRASVNLTVASVLIAFGTSLKLPLSTTYVTFMVAMGTSLADNAWGRESAVYRISGVMAVIGGWFLTAISAFTVAFLIVLLFFYGDLYAMFGMVVVVIYIIYRSHRYHQKSTNIVDEDVQSVRSLSEDNIAEQSKITIITNLQKVIEVYGSIINALEKEDKNELKVLKADIDSITAKTKYMKDNINVIVDKLRVGSVDTAYYFVQVLDFMREMLHSISYINNPAYVHLDNNHKPLIKEQIDELKQFNIILEELFSKITSSIESCDYTSRDQIQSIFTQILELIELSNKKQIKRIKNGVVGTKNSMLFMNIINETKYLSLNAVNLYKSQRDFVIVKNKK